MQKTKVVQVGDRAFVVKELPVRAVWGLLNNEGGQESGDMLERVQSLLALACPELDKKTLLDLYPSEIEELWQGFEEVNASFLAMVRLVGIDQALVTAIKEVITTSIGQFAASLPAVTAP